MTKGEFTNNLIYDMAGYLDAEGTERLKMALAYRMKGFHLVPDETLPATVHVYRKTFASREYQRTKDILYVSHRLGHANTAVTEKYYICDDILADRKMANVA